MTHGEPKRNPHCSAKITHAWYRSHDSSHRIRESLNTLPWVTCSTPFLQFTYQIPNFHFCIGSKTPGQLNSLLPENILIKRNTLNIRTENRF